MDVDTQSGQIAGFDVWLMSADVTWSRFMPDELVLRLRPKDRHWDAARHFATERVAFTLADRAWVARTAEVTVYSTRSTTVDERVGGLTMAEIEIVLTCWPDLPAA